MSVHSDFELCPVDELYLVRQQIAALRAREDRLRNGLEQGRFALRGRWAEAEIVSRTRRCFLRDRLPSEITGNDRYWRDMPRISVLTRARAAGAGDGNHWPEPTLMELPDDDFDVIEPF